MTDVEKIAKEYLTTGNKNVQLVYGLMILALAVPILQVVAAVIAYLNLEEKDKVLKSHYQFLFRTCWMIWVFWLAAMFTLFLSFVLYILIIVWYVMRLYRGYCYINKQQAHPCPKTWWIGKAL